MKGLIKVESTVASTGSFADELESRLDETPANTSERIFLFVHNEKIRLPANMDCGIAEYFQRYIQENEYLHITGCYLEGVAGMDDSDVKRVINAARIKAGILSETPEEK